MPAASLHLGSFGDDVARLHQALTQRGFVVSRDEIKRRFFGPATRAALLEFQKRHRLDATGAVDARTAALLSVPLPPGTAALRAGSAARAAPGSSPARSVATGRSSAFTVGSAASGSVASVPAASAGATHAGSVLGNASGIDLDNIPVVTGTFERPDPCAEPVETFATDRQILPVMIEPNAVTEVRFGPANAGPGIVTVEMYPVPDLPSAPGPGRGVQLARRAAGTVRAGGTTGTVGGVVRVDTDTGPGGGGSVPPGGGLLPQGAFRIEIQPIGVGATVVAVGPAPLMFTLPAPPPARLPPITPQDSTAPNWIVRITNTTSVNASGRVFVTFVGNRPILRKTLDVDALNHLLCRVVAGSAPITIALENRTQTVSVQTPSGVIKVNVETTWLVALPDPDMQRQFGLHEFNLGMKILKDARVESEPATVRLVVNDGRLALKARIGFPYGATLLLGNLMKGLVGSVTGGIVDSLLGISDEAKMRTLSADVMFTIRDGSLNSLQGANDSADILVRPYVDLEGISRTLTMLVETLVEGFIARAYDFGNPLYAKLEKVRNIAATIRTALARYLLGRDLPEITRQSAPGITLSFAGDAPLGPVLTDGGDDAPPDAPLPDPGLLANIDHIVVLMMENRSFDHVLGHLSLPTSLGGLGRGEVSGLHGTEFNLQHDGSRVYAFPFTRPPATLFGYDPGHGFSDQKIQRGGQTLKRPGTTSPKPTDEDDDIGTDAGTSKDITVPPMGGFVLAHARQLAAKYSATELNDASRNYGNVATDIMGYHLPADVPMYSFLAENYLICDHWFAAHPGNTWPNRFITLTGNLAPKPPHDPHAGAPEIGTPDPQDFTPVRVKNIFDHLDAAGVTWRYYEHDLCMLRLFADYTLGHPNIVQIGDPVQGLEAAARAGTLPSVTFIDPDLTDVPAGNDDHPPTDIARGQPLVKRVYDAIATSPLWEKTLLIITYDEYGGFYDHVLPREVSDPQDPEYVSPMFTDPQFPEQAPPGQFHPQPVHYRGVRVPTFIISPWVQKRGVSHLTFDHTSILKTILTRFLHENPPNLGERVSRANGLERVLSAPRVMAGAGGGMVATQRVARAAAVSPRLAATAVARVAIAPGRHADDFRTLLSAVRDRFGMKTATPAGPPATAESK